MRAGALVHAALFTDACGCKVKGTEAERDTQGQVWLGYRCVGGSIVGLFLGYVAKKQHQNLHAIYEFNNWWL